MAQALYKSNDNLLEIDGLKNAATDAYIDDATVTVTLVDAEGAEVTGQSWPTTMSYVASSNGKYRAVLKDALSVTNLDRYTAKITADGGSDLLGYWEFPLSAIVRTTQQS